MYFRNIVPSRGVNISLFSRHPVMFLGLAETGTDRYVFNRQQFGKDTVRLLGIVIVYLSAR